MFLDQQDSTIPTLYVANPSYIPPQASKPIQKYIADTKERLEKGLKQYPHDDAKDRQHPTFNLCIRALKAEPSIHIAKADKNLGIIVMQRTDYEAEALRQLRNILVYDGGCY